MWNQAPGSADVVRYQYTNVLYTSGYYNCYTLAVTLGSVCNAEQGATFSASPNDPGNVNCTCPSGNACNPYVDLTQVMTVGEGGGRMHGGRVKGCAWGEGASLWPMHASSYLHWGDKGVNLGTGQRAT